MWVIRAVFGGLRPLLSSCADWIIHCKIEGLYYSCVVTSASYLEHDYN